MKPVNKSFAGKMLFSISFLFLFFFLASNASAQVTVAGTVFDKQRNPLPQIDVELLNDLYQTIDRTHTDGTGRYQFNGLKDGRYWVKVFAFRYDLLDDTHQVEIQTVTVRGTQGVGFYTEDFYLSPKKGGLRDAELSVIFAQDVPKEAKKAYDKAIDDLSKKHVEEGIQGLKNAINIFPTYYLALYRFGFELYMRQQYIDAVRLFIKAADVNPKSATSFYYLGSALHKAGKEYDKSALTALSEAYVLAPNSSQVLLQLGVVERALGKFADAEKHLLQAEKLSTTKVPEIHKELSQLYANDLKKYDAAANELENYIKASKLSDADEKKMRQVVADLRAKAKAQPNN